MSSGKIQAKIRHEIRSVGLFYAGWMEKGEKCKERHSIMALVYTSIEGQKTCYSRQTLDVQWCCLLINLFSYKAEPVKGLHIPIYSTQLLCRTSQGDDSEHPSSSSYIQ